MPTTLCNQEEAATSTDGEQKVQRQLYGDISTDRRHVDQRCEQGAEVCLSES